MLEDVVGTDETYAYNFGRVGFVRFESKSQMFAFCKAVGTKPKPKVDGKEVWISVSKSPEERNKANTLGKFKRVLIKTSLATPDNIKIDYKISSEIGAYLVHYHIIRNMIGSLKTLK